MCGDEGVLSGFWNCSAYKTPSWRQGKFFRLFVKYKRRPPSLVTPPRVARVIISTPPRTLEHSCEGWDVCCERSSYPSHLATARLPPALSERHGTSSERKRHREKVGILGSIPSRHNIISDRRARRGGTEISESLSAPRFRGKKGKRVPKKISRDLHPTAQRNCALVEEKSVPGNTSGNESWVAAAAAVGRTAVKAEEAMRSSACRGSKEVSAPLPLATNVFSFCARYQKKTPFGPPPPPPPPKHFFPNLF